jgi:hypothetical protein
MRAHILFFILGMAVSPAARAQSGFPGGGPGTQLAQFQGGIRPQGSNFDLAPGQTIRLALFCTDLFADTPTDRVTFTSSSADAIVTLASGDQMSLQDAMTAGLIHARGRGPGDLPRREGGQWFDAFLASTTYQPIHVSLPAGTLLVPAGQPIPEISPAVRRLFEVAQARGLAGSDTVAHAVWATRGFTREDIEQTTMTSLPDTEAKNVQALLTAANLDQTFDRDSGQYAKLYEQRRDTLDAAASLHGSAVMPSGRNVPAEVVADTAGNAVVMLSPAAKGPLYYAGRVTSRRSDRLVVALLHLKTGRPLEAVRAPILVKLSPGTELARRSE